MRLGKSRTLALGLLIGLPTIVHAEPAGVLVETSDSDDKSWHFGVGTGLSSFSLNGDIGFARTAPAGGFIADVDLDNSETSDLVDSGLGVSGIATRGPLSILVSFGKVTLEDSSSGLDGKWERTKSEIVANYRFFQSGRHNIGVIAGVRNIAHDWEIKDTSTGAAAIPDVDDDWTDLVLGMTYLYPINAQWAWSNRLDWGFGDTEASFYAATSLNWKPFEHWLFNANVKYTKLEIGDSGDINKPDFYYYDVEEPSIGLGFMYVW